MLGSRQMPLSSRLFVKLAWDPYPRSFNTIENDSGGAWPTFVRESCDSLIIQRKALLREYFFWLMGRGLFMFGI